MNRSENLRPTQQNLRYGAYPSQPAPQTRNTPLGTARLQNSSNKLGNGTAWGFGAPANGALPSAQPRPTGVGSSSFAQTIGGSQPAASLDITDFPSLGPASQSQYQNTSQSIWANQRAAQQTPVQRPQQQQQHVISSQASQQRQQAHHAQDQPQRVNDGAYSSTSHLHSGVDDDRYHNTLGQISTARQPPTTSVDAFPPLGRHGSDDIEDRRGNMMQNAGLGAFTNVNAFSLPQDQPQPRNALQSASSSQANNTRSPSAMERITSPNGIGFGAQLSGRSPTESNRQGISGVQDHDRNHVSASQANQRHEHSLNALMTNFDSQFPSQQQGSQSSHIQQEYGGRTGDPGSAHTPDRPQMSAMEEFGLPGLLATIRSANPDVAGLARGQDLTSLGLNLNSPEPLWPTFAGPFAEPGSRPMQPDFTLPECYTVDNVNRVKDKIPGFSDETLFWIFYTQPQDILQEFAASELTVRNWRFHKGHQMWLTKNPSLGEPINMGPEKENGSYIFFNHNAWEKMNLSNFDLHYSQLAPVSTVRPNGQ
ncbi:hypothetical protein N7G274_006882 [Stereocaulon virgatum]|uniref:NOT2/NOT3/NOT5 C-terminal domain-containing protein n=1 Tax=Stereocaulon virgatum TaxID=373712 RepID=A0ABR4A3D5_9LECA